MTCCKWWMIETNGKRERERVKEICTSSTIWWWWRQPHLYNDFLTHQSYSSRYNDKKRFYFLIKLWQTIKSNAGRSQKRVLYYLLIPEKQSIHSNSYWLLIEGYFHSLFSGLSGICAEWSILHGRFEAERAPTGFSWATNGWTSCIIDTFVTLLWHWTLLSSLSYNQAYMPGPRFRSMSSQAHQAHIALWADDQHSQAGFEPWLGFNLPLS